MRARALVTLAILLLSGAARADGDSHLEALSRRATSLYQAGDYRSAIVTLLECYELKHDSRFLFNIARAYEKSHESADAARFYRLYLDGSDTEPRLVERAKEGLTRLDPKPPAEPPAPPAPPPAAAPSEAPPPSGAGAPVQAAPVSPPAVAPPSRPPAPEPPRVSTPLAKAPPAPTRTSHVASYVLMSTGAVSLLAGGALAFWANATATQMHDSLDPTRKPQLRTDALTRAVLADTALGVGAVALGTGIIVRCARSDQATLRVSVGGIALSYSPAWW